ncbi:MAG: hypothetical protein EXS00_04580 [Phycisphaerales bacterium]|nr:hypothetical protein [Phycisphaerales bacterium]
MDGSPACDNPAAISLALLEHRCLDGSVHFDLLLAPPKCEGDPSGIATWRVRERIDLGCLPAHALRIEDHRTLYLNLAEERDLGPRGSVRRVASGWWRRGASPGTVHLHWSAQATVLVNLDWQQTGEFFITRAEQSAQPIAGSISKC